MNSIVSFLNDCLNKKKAIITCVSNPMAYSEYAPYEVISDLGDFIKRALSI